MHPELFRLHLGAYERPFYSYGACIVVGMTIGVLIAVARSRKYELARFDELAVALLAIAGGIAGAALLYFVVHARELIAHPTRLTHLGLVFYGGFLGGALAAWLYCRRWNVSLAAAADAGAPGLAIGHAIGRVGCLLGGCCYGRPCAPDFPLGVELHGALRHPVQLYEAAGLIAIACVLFALTNRLRDRAGALASLYAVGYALLRLFTESLRGDDVERGFVVPGLVSTSQAIALALLILALIFFVRARRGNPRSPHAA